jgi:acyl dehydratase
MSHAPAVLNVTRLADFIGREALSSWLEVSQEAITGFAEVTGDRQWIHVDPDRARTESPFGATIAHGFLTLSLISRLMRDAIRFDSDPRMAINYGLNKVRFPSPLPSGSRIRGRFTLLSVEATARGNTADGGRQAAWSAVVEVEGTGKPCCVAEWLVRYYP